MSKKKAPIKLDLPKDLPAVFPFEEKVIDLILNTIKDNQKYLCKKKNLPQLAKLGYMYNTLWYSGRVAWGSDGPLIPEEIKKLSNEIKNRKDFYDIEFDDDAVVPYFGQCEDNPKYKIEMCEPENERIDNLIYDAWGMHVSNDLNIPWEEFSGIVLKGRELTEYDKKAMKVGKTFEEWVKILTDKNYPYHSIYPDRRSVLNHVLCVIGNGYNYNKKGYVTGKASGADQDIDLYGDWENCVFRDDIKKIVDSIMEMPEVKQTIDSAYIVRKKYQDERREKEEAQERIAFGGMTYKEFRESEKYQEMKKDPKYKDIFGDSEKYYPYYPLCDYSIITQFDKNTHPSYIKAGIEICEEILAHREEEEKENHGHNNVPIAEKLLKKFREYVNQ
jgi:hypothetical protein